MSSWLVALFNGSLESASFPSIWKCALIRPLSKIRTPLSPSDTRPIANLPELSKLLERVVAEQIMSYLNKYDLLDPRQSAYRSGYSTQSALLRVCDDIREGIDDRLATIMVLFDFSKAFDTVPHLRLLVKLKCLGFSDVVLCWFFHYLTGRSQAVVDDEGGCSGWLSTSLGVPQGSVLDPLLFSLFINDISDALSNSKHMLFADDLQIYLSCPPAEILQGLRLISQDVHAIFEYAGANGLKLNLEKSKVIIFSGQAYASSIDVSRLPPVTVGMTSLPFVSEVRNLGITLMSDLSWKRHVLHVSQCVHRALYMLKFNKNSLSEKLRIKLVVTLILPHIDYCSLVYHGLSSELNVRLQRLVNCCVRFIFNLRRDEHITPFRRRLGWVSVENRRLFFLGCQIYRILYMTSPSYLHELFIPSDPTLRRSERSLHPSSQTFHIPSHRTATYKNSFRLSSIYFWHSLPDHITSAPSLATFKNLLRSFLIASEFA